VNLCVEKEIEIPGLSQDKQAEIDAGRKQMGTILGRLFGTKSEIKVEDFKVVKVEETAHTDQGNPQVLKKYTFSMAQKPNQTTAPLPINPVPALIPNQQS